MDRQLYLVAAGLTAAAAVTALWACTDAALPVLEELLGHPQISTVRTDRTADASDWEVRRPVGRSSPRVPAIIEPRDGDRLIAMGGSIEITPKLRVSGEGETLFLNGRPVDGARLRLKPGRVFDTFDSSIIFNTSTCTF